MFQGDGWDRLVRRWDGETSNPMVIGKWQRTLEDEMPHGRWWTGGMFLDERDHEQHPNIRKFHCFRNWDRRVPKIRPWDSQIPKIHIGRPAFCPNLVSFNVLDFLPFYQTILLSFSRTETEPNCFLLLFPSEHGIYVLSRSQSIFSSAAMSTMSGDHPTGGSRYIPGCIPNPVNNGFQLPTSTGFSTRFLKHQQDVHM